jgi:hypothetical protein
MIRLQLEIATPRLGSAFDGVGISRAEKESGRFFQPVFLEDWDKVFHFIFST